MAGLFENKELFCTGAFIARFHILTVALCLIKFFTNLGLPLENYHAQSGKMLTPFEVLRYQFEKVEIHKDYNYRDRTFLYNNIGVITVIIVTHAFKDCR